MILDSLNKNFGWDKAVISYFNTNGNIKYRDLTFRFSTAFHGQEKEWMLQFKKKFKTEDLRQIRKGSIMKQLQIQNTEITALPFGLGTVNAGLQWDGADADRIFDAFVDRGGTLIDTAHVYSDWVKPERARSERVLGDWLARSGKRNQIILMTKGGHPDMTAEHPDTHRSRMTRADMTEDLEGSLRQLRTDCIDIYFYHRDDMNQPVEELVEVMETFRKAGKIRYYACSNWTTDRMKEADAYCSQNGYRGFIGNQSLFNLGYRYMNPLPDDTLVYADEKMQQYHRENPGNLLMPYMGVCSGFFHKYVAKGREAVQESPYCTEGNLKVAERVKELCERYEATVSQVVLGFFWQQDFSCAPLYGPKDVSQLEEAMKTFEIPFKKEDYDLVF